MVKLAKKEIAKIVTVSGGKRVGESDAIIQLGLGFLAIFLHRLFGLE